MSPHHTGPRDPLPARPPWGARTVGRPRVTMVLFSGALVGFGLLALSGPRTGGILAGLCMLIPGAFMLFCILSMRVKVHEKALYLRRPLGWRPPLRLDELSGGDILDGGPNTSREVVLRDRRGCELRIPPMLIRLAGLYRVLGDPEVVGSPGPIFDGELGARVPGYLPPHKRQPGVR